MASEISEYENHLVNDKAVVICSEAEQHGSIDVWLLMLLAGLGTRRCEAVRKLLKKKFAEGHAHHAWLTGAIANHPVRFLLLPYSWLHMDHAITLM